MSNTYVVFIEQPIQATRKTGIWRVRSTGGTPLGEVRFFGRWRCFVFYPDPDTLYNKGCLTDIATFCDTQTEAWRSSLTPEPTGPA